MNTIRIVFIAGILCTSSLNARILWDSNSDIRNWSSQNIEYKLGDNWDYISVGFRETGFQNRISSQDGYLGTYMFASTNIGDMSDYKNGILSFNYKDTRATPGGEMTPPEYVFFSGMVGGENIILGYELKFSEDWQTASITIDKSTLRSCVITTEDADRRPESLNFEWMELTDAEFDEFLKNASLHIRSDSYEQQQPVGGESGDWFSNSFFDTISLAQIPEANSFAIAAGVAVTILFVTRRRRQ